MRTKASLSGALAIAGALLLALGMDAKRPAAARPPPRSWAPIIRPLVGRDGFELHWIEA